MEVAIDSRSQVDCGKSVIGGGLMGDHVLWDVDLSLLKLWCCGINMQSVERTMRKKSWEWEVSVKDGE